MIVCCHKALRGWKRRAGAAWKREYMELLYGYKERSIRYVTRCVQIPQKGSCNQVSPAMSEDAYEQFIAEQEAKLGLDWLGTIHSHVYECEHECPSYADNKVAVSDGEEIFAIDTILKQGKAGRLSHTIKWYEPQVAIEEVTLV